MDEGNVPWQTKLSTQALIALMDFRLVLVFDASGSDFVFCNLPHITSAELSQGLKLQIQQYLASKPHVDELLKLSQDHHTQKKIIISICGHFYLME